MKGIGKHWGLRVYEFGWVGSEMGVLGGTGRRFFEFFYIYYGTICCCLDEWIYTVLGFLIDYGEGRCIRTVCLR